MNSRTLASASWWLIFMFSASLSAFAGGPSATTIAQIVAESSLVVAGRIQHFVKSPAADNELRLGVASGAPGPDRANTRHVSGTYTFSILKSIKGQCLAALEINLPPVLFQNYGDRKLRIANDGICLLYLSQKDADRLGPTDERIPLVPLGRDVLRDQDSEKKIKVNPVDATVRLLVASVSDSDARASSLFFLIGTRGDAVVKAARQYADDSDPDVQQSALSCLAANNVVEVIPRIAEVAADTLQAGRGSSRVVEELEWYDVPEAVPYLNVLVVDPRSSWTRLNAVQTLNQNRLADATSIPYLIQALRDREPQGIVAFDAYVILHRLIPTIGPRQDRSYFKAHQDEEVKAIEKWWADHLVSQSGQKDPSSQPQ